MPYVYSPMSQRRPLYHSGTLSSTYNKVAFNEKLPITKENLCTKYTPFTHKYIVLNEKPPIMKQNLCIFFFVIGGVECNLEYTLSIALELSLICMRMQMDQY